LEHRNQVAVEARQQREGRRQETLERVAPSSSVPYNEFPEGF